MTIAADHTMPREVLQPKAHDITPAWMNEHIMAGMLCLLKCLLNPVGQLGTKPWRKKKKQQKTETKPE